MKLFTVILSICLLLAGVALAASIDGKWAFERKMERDGQSFSIKQVFDLKADGNKLTGKVSMVFGNQEPRSSDIQGGKIEGNKFSFTTVVTTPNGEFKSVYEGTVEGDTMKGNMTRQGGQGASQPRPFEAKRQ